MSDEKKKRNAEIRKYESRESEERKRMYRECREEEEGCGMGGSSVLFVMHDRLTQGTGEGNCSF